MKTLVETEKGKFEGIKGRLHYKWLGIPYAKAPVGDLRFRRAQEIEPFAEIRLCDQMGAKPVQMAGGKFAELTASKTVESEDCLTLNVWAPNDAVKEPVFVWFYGGAHHAGEASAPEYDLGSFADNKVVSVSFNYRLGALGFYDFSAYGDAYESNCAISDMLMALRFVKAHIAQFGGDPERITLCGESAGASAIMALFGCKEAQNLFSQAILMSPVAGNTTGQRVQRINNDRFLKRLGVDSKNIDRLKLFPTGALQEACGKFFSERETVAPGILTNGPVLDDLIQKLPLQAIADGDVRDKKLLFGTCKNEGGLFRFMKICLRDWADVEKMLSQNGLEGKLSHFQEVYGKVEERDAIDAINTDRIFWADIMKAALAQSAFADTFLYRFDFEMPLGRLLKVGATHTMDVCPALHTWEGHMSLFYRGVKMSDRERLYDEMHSAFLSFIKTGNPTHKLLGEWPKFEKEKKAAMVFDRKSHVSTEVYDEKRFALWKDIALYAGD